jgi:hypothetical protein
VTIAIIPRIPTAPIMGVIPPVVTEMPSATPMISIIKQTNKRFLPATSNLRSALSPFRVYKIKHTVDTADIIQTRVIKALAAMTFPQSLAKKSPFLPHTAAVHFLVPSEFVRHFSQRPNADVP